MKKSVRLHGEDGQALRWINQDDHSEMLALGTAEVYRDASGKFLGIKLCKRAPEECEGFSFGVESPTGLTAGDMERNAAGVVDTSKRRIVYKMRDEGKPIAASLRSFGRDKDDKPNRDLIGNTVDRSMSRVEQWPLASETNRALTCVPGGVIKLTEMTAKELAAQPAFAL